MEREVLANVTFEENCEYQSSAISKKVLIPQQIVNIELQNPINMESNDGIFYYDDRVELIAKVSQSPTSFIQTGRVEFYFQPEGSANAELINKKIGDNDTCVVNKNGSAAVVFKPRASGIVYAKYIDDNNIYTAVTDTNPNGISEIKNIVLKEIPVKVEFAEVPPYLASVHDEVKVKVHVTHGRDNKDVEYGTVTFMHYLTYDDIHEIDKRIPKVIGNPVPVVDGYAEISYIPVQTDDDSEPEKLKENEETRYIEYLRASYNYTGKYVNNSKDEYKWKYYGTSSKWTSINVLARNSITIGASLSLSDSPDIYQCSENDTITLTAVLKDKDDNNIEFSNHSGELTFHITGTHAHPKNDYILALPPTQYQDSFIDVNFNFIHHTIDIPAAFSNNQFTAQLHKLLPGFYTITATTTIQTEEGETLINYTNTIDNDKKYAPINESNTLYITSNYADITEDYNIDLQHDTYYVHSNSKVNNLKGIVTGLSDNQKSILNNHPCEFYVSELHKAYRGTLSYNARTKILTGTPSDDIIFNIPDNYTISMYIPRGIYSSNPNITTYHHDITGEQQDQVHDFYLPHLPSAPIVIQARDTIELELDVDTITNVCPAQLSYELTGKRIIDFTSIDIIVKSGSSEEIVDTVELFKLLTTATNTIEIDTPGTHQIYAKVGDVVSNVVTVEIDKDSFGHELLESSKTLFGSVGNTMGVYLYCVYDIELLNQSKLHFYIYDKNKSNKVEASIQNIKKIDKTTDYVTICPGIGVAGQWFLEVVYDGDNYFNPYTSVLEEFVTELDTPQVKIIPYNNTYGVQISGLHEHNDIIVAKVVFIYKNSPTPVSEGLLITDESGYGEIVTATGNITQEEWWKVWDNIAIIFNPYDTELVNILSNNQVPYQQLKEKYDYIFDYKNLTNNIHLRLQLQDNNNKYIYEGYRAYEARFARPTQL